MRQVIMRDATSENINYTPMKHQKHKIETLLGADTFDFKPKRDVTPTLDIPAKNISLLVLEIFQKWNCW